MRPLHAPRICPGAIAIARRALRACGRQQQARDPVPSPVPRPRKPHADRPGRPFTRIGTALLKAVGASDAEADAVAVGCVNAIWPAMTRTASSRSRPISTASRPAYRAGGQMDHRAGIADHDRD